MAGADGSFGYEMEIITYPGSGIEKVEESRVKPLRLHHQLQILVSKHPQLYSKKNLI